MSMENRLFAVKTPHEMLDCCFLFASRLLVSGQWYIGVGQFVDGGAYHLYDVLLTDGGVTVLPHPHSAPAWELPYERIAELPKPYRGSDAERPLPPFLLSQMDRRLLPVHDEAVLYPYRVLSCLSAASSVAEYFTRKEALAAERGDGRDAVFAAGRAAGGHGGRMHAFAPQPDAAEAAVPRALPVEPPAWRRTLPSGSA